MAAKKKRPSIVREAPAEHRPSRRISATEAARNFSELLNRVRYRGESFVIERGGVPVGELRPVAPPRFTGADLLALFSSLPEVDREYLDTVERAVRAQPQVPESPWEC